MKDIESIEKKKGSDRINIRYVRRDLEAYQVFDFELENLTSLALNTSLSTTIVGISVGVFVSCLIALLTDYLEDWKILSTITSITFISFLTSAYFGIHSIRGYLNLKKEVSNIKESKQLKKT